MAGKKYNWREFTLKVAVKAKPERVYRMWTEPKELVKWFLETAKMELKKGGAYEWSWLGGGRDKGKIIAFRKPSLLHFTFAGCKCEIRITKDKRGALVTLRQYAIPTDEKNKVGTHMSCSLGWSFYLANLKAFLEHGVDLRETDPKHLKEGTVLY
jgi:uncharacterized protein YndB with AHSA1/START domain